MIHQFRSKILVQDVVPDRDPGSGSGVTTRRRWGAFLAGAFLLYHIGRVVLTTSAPAERWLAGAVMPFTLYLIAGAFAPGLLRFVNPVVIVVYILFAALMFVRGEPILAMFLLCMAGVYLLDAYIGLSRRRKDDVSPVTSAGGR